MTIQDDKTILSKADLKEYHNRILPYLGGNMMMSTNNSDFYSTDEKVVGVWLDGKPLYQKTLVSNTATSGSKDLVLGTISNAETIFIISGFYINNTSDVAAIGAIMDLNTSGRNSDTRFASYTYIRPNGNVGVYYGSATATTKTVATVRYTKTTDTASTALTTPGAYDINFPNTWPENKEIFFGNGLYGYRAKGNFTATSTGSSFTLNLVANADNFTIVNTGGSAKVTNSGNSTVMRMLGVNWSQTDAKPTIAILIDRGTNNYLRFQVIFVTDKATTSNTYDVWVTYTK